MGSIPTAGINGFGRFGMHLLRYWIENYSEALFSIEYINDEHLSANDIRDILKNDPYLDMPNVSVGEDAMVIKLPGGIDHRIRYSNYPLEEIPWLGLPRFFLECSGRHTSRKSWDSELTGNTQLVIISATATSADQVLIYGFNHAQPLDGKVISYGSCTVNAYVPLADAINKNFGVLNSDVNIIHNIPVYKNASFKTLKRKECTLAQMGPKLLSFLNPNNFKVNYTLIPYNGVSIIDFRFKLKESFSQEAAIKFFRDICQSEDFINLYKIVSEDSGPEAHKFTPASAVIVESTVDVVGDNLYFMAYFDNENSVNRYFDLINYISDKDEAI